MISYRARSAINTYFVLKKIKYAFFLATHDRVYECQKYLCFAFYFIFCFCCFVGVFLFFCFCFLFICLFGGVETGVQVGQWRIFMRRSVSNKEKTVLETFLNLKRDYANDSFSCMKWDECYQRNKQKRN